MSEDLTKKRPNGDPDPNALILKDISLRISVINDTLLLARAELLALRERVHGLEQHQDKPTNSQT